MRLPETAAGPVLVPVLLVFFRFSTGLTKCRKAWHFGGVHCRSCLLPIVHYQMFTVHCPLRTVHCPLPSVYRLATAHYSLSFSTVH
jgi:hypothetical protein